MKIRFEIDGSDAAYCVFVCVQEPLVFHIPSLLKMHACMHSLKTGVVEVTDSGRDVRPELGQPTAPL